jgi:hypothetical protein
MAVLEMEHRPYDIRALRDCLQYMLDRRRILQRGALAPAVTPFVRLPLNGGVANQWFPSRSWTKASMASFGRSRNIMPVPDRTAFAHLKTRHKCKI